MKIIQQAKNEKGEWKDIEHYVHNFCGNYTYTCLLYTSDAADERSSVDLGGRRIIKKKKHIKYTDCRCDLINRQTRVECSNIELQQSTI